MTRESGVCALFASFVSLGIKNRFFGRFPGIADFCHNLRAARHVFSTGSGWTGYSIVKELGKSGSEHQPGVSERIPADYFQVQE